MSLTIIIGFDGSASGRDALSLGALLGDVTGARLLAVSSYEHEFYAANPSVESWRSAKRHQAEATAEQARGLLEGVQRSETAVIGAPSPARALHEAAIREQADLLIVGSSSPGRFRAGARRERRGTSASWRAMCCRPCPKRLRTHGVARCAAPRWGGV